jgi:hypothetical protein
MPKRPEVLSTLPLVKEGYYGLMLAVSRLYKSTSSKTQWVSWPKNTSVRQLAVMEEESLVARCVEGRRPSDAVAQLSGNHRH